MHNIGIQNSRPRKRMRKKNDLGEKYDRMISNSTRIKIKNQPDGLLKKETHRTVIEGCSTISMESVFFFFDCVRILISWHAIFAPSQKETFTFCYFFFLSLKVSNNHKKNYTNERMKIYLEVHSPFPSSSFFLLYSQSIFGNLIYQIYLKYSN